MKNYVGQQLGNYRLTRLLGQGGFAEIYLGEHIHLRTLAAIKVLQMRLAENNAEAFIQEARMVAHLVHPHIIRVLDFGVREEVPFLVMDYASGGTLRQRYLRGTPLPPATLFPHISNIASALQYAHNNKLVHRDVKPENMLIGANNEVLLSDFGLALIAYNNPSTKKDMSGTVTYMAPEQVQGRARPASDQYALAVVAYEWLTGTLPFHGSISEIASQQVLAPPPSLRERAPTISYEVERVVFKALAKNPLQRFATIVDFAEALQEACMRDTRQTSAIMWAQQKPQQLRANTTFPQREQTGRMRSINPQAGQVPFTQAPWPQSNRSHNMQPASSPTNTSHLAASPSQIFAVQREVTGRVNAVQNSFVQRNATGKVNTVQNSFVQREATGKVNSVQNSFVQHEASGKINAVQSSFTQPNMGNRSTVSPFYAGPTTPEQQMHTSKYLPIASNVIPNAIAGQSGAMRLPAKQALQNQQSTKMAAVNAKNAANSKNQESKPVFSAQTWLLVGLLIVVLIAGSGMAGFLYLASTGKSANLPMIDTGKNTHAPTTTSVSNAATTVPTVEYPPANLPQLNDPLLINQLHWDEGSSCNFIASGYQITSPSGNSTTCYAHNTNYYNFVYQMQMTFVKAGTPDSAGGITFRGDSNTNTAYTIEIFASGKFSFTVQTGNATPKVITGYQKNAQSIADFNTQLGANNTIAIVANDNQFTFYVNDKRVFGPIQDNALSSGMLGIVASGGDTEVTFNDMRVWQL